MSSLKIARNAIFNVMSFGVNLVVTFFLVPVMLQFLGSTGFGVWAVVRAFLSYASLGDLGLTSTVTKYVAEYAARNEPESIARVLKAAFILYVFILIVLFLFLIVFQQVIVSLFFSTSGPFASDITFVLYASMAVFGINMVFSVFPNALAGIQRMDLTNTVLAVYTLLNGVCMYAALLMGMGLRGLVWANALATVVATMMNGALFFRSFKHLPLMRTSVTITDIRQLFGFSKHVFAVSIASNIHMHFDKLLLSSFVNLNVVGAYEVGSRIVQQVRQIPVLMLNPLLPAASEVHAQERTDNLRRLYLRSVKYLLVLSVPLLGCAGFYAEPFVRVWLHSADSLIVPTAQILMLSNFINLVTGPGFYISIGIGNARFPMYSSIVGLILNIVLSIVLLKLFGYFGAVFGSFSALIAASVFFLWLVHRDMDVRTSIVVRMAAKPAVALLGGVVLGFVAGHFVTVPIPQLLIMIVVTLAVYGVGLWRMNYFDSDDRETADMVRRALVARLVGRGGAEDA